MLRFFRKTRHVLERVPPFLKAAFSSKGIVHRDGRQLIFGKLRRSLFSVFPGVARYLQKHYGLVGGCKSCGASCKMLFQCPHWDDKTHLCSVYEDRPSICRTFPITPADLKDRDLVLKEIHCGFDFDKK